MVLIQFVQINLDNFSVFFSLDNALCKGTWIKNVDNQINTTIIKFINEEISKWSLVTQVSSKDKRVKIIQPASELIDEFTMWLDMIDKAA